MADSLPATSKASLCWLEMPKKPSPQVVKFRLGWSTTVAAGYRNDSKHPNVWRLSIIRSPFEHSIISLLLWLPLSLQTLAKTIVPSYFLPSRIVLKKLKPRWDDEFNHERKMYSQLQALQGQTIPWCFGDASCDGTRALVLSEIDGVVPFEQESSAIDADEFQRRLEAAFGELAAFGLVHGDPKLDNFLLVKDKIVVVDLESLEQDSPENIEFFSDAKIEHLVERYEAYLESRERDRRNGWPQNPSKLVKRIEKKAAT